jgi:Tol biopolymer transport system component
MNAMMFAMRHKGSTKNSVTTESPVYPLVKDGSGRRSGFLPNGQPIQEIPESRAIVLGDKHLILFDGADNAQVEIVGYANGTMDMHTFFVHADGTATSATFVDVPVNRGMQVKGASSDVQSNLTVDSNGDGQTDGMLTPSTHNIVPAPSSAPGNIPGGNSYSFPQTGFSVSGRLWELWRSNRSFDDSLYINGFPITSLRPEVSTTDGKVYQTQWFERARFEEHPENQAPHDVLLGLLGVSAAKGRENEAPFRPVGNPGGGIVWFLETQHTLGDSSEGGKAIAAYWNRLGGLPQFGFPLSQPFMEKSKDDGKMYLVQYFQRQRFEYHQENKGTRYEVLLGRLGAEQEERAPSSAVGKLAFTSERNGNTEVHVISADGSQQKQLTNSPPKNQSPSWSPDGKRLVFLSGRSGGDQLYVMNDDGTSQMQLTKTPPGIDPALWSARIDQPAWSPSGQSIAFVSVGTENRADIYTINADGTNLRRITSSPAIDSSPVWSPDGSRLAFVTDRDHQPDIYVMNADGSSQIRVGDASPGDSSPTWSPDGKRIAFQADANPGTHAVYIVNADGSSQRRLTEDKGEGLPAWSPDGRRIAFTSAKTGTPSIYVINTDGTGQTLLTSGPEDRDPEWSPDGQWIAFESRRDGNWQIYVVSSDGSTQMRLTHNSTNDHHPVWAPH